MPGAGEKVKASDDSGLAPYNRKLSHAQSKAGQSTSDVHSSQRSRRSRRFRARGGQSGIDSESNVSGLMSRQQSKKRSVRRRGKGGVSLAIQNETLITKIQEQLAELKNTMQADI